MKTLLNNLDKQLAIQEESIQESRRILTAIRKAMKGPELVEDFMEEPEEIFKGTKDSLEKISIRNNINPIILDCLTPVIPNRQQRRESI